MKQSNKHNRILIAIVVLFAVLCNFTSIVYGSKSKKDWPRWRGQNYDGRALETNVFKEGYGIKVAWKKALGSGYSSISITDGRAITTLSDSASSDTTFDYIVAFDVDDGRELWRYKIDSTYVGINGASNGQISTPFINKDKVFIYARKGELLALNAKNGHKIWSHNLKDEMEAVEPTYGFASSPIVVGDVLICQVGAPNERSVCGFDKNNGKLLWSAASDIMEYQSPIYAELAGEKQIISVGDSTVFGLKPRTGEILWHYRHAGGNNTTNPIVVGEGKLFIKHSFNGSMMLKVTKSNNDFSVEKVWEKNTIRGALAPTIAHNGYLYGYVGRILTCVDAETGDSVWKSRQPGPGFSILVDNHLVIITQQKGTMHIVEASPAGYKEIAATTVFTGQTHTPPSFAYGSIFVRNQLEIARVDIAEVDEVIAKETRPAVKGVLPESKFAAFVARVEKTTNKKAMIDDFMARQTSFPIIEGDDIANIVFRGQAKDIAISGDFIASGTVDPMNRIADTDLYYYSVKLEPDAVVAYQFTKDFGTAAGDTLNLNNLTNFTGENGVIYMPESGDRSHLNDPDGLVRGKIDTFHFESKIMEVSRKIEVYLPSGYDIGDRRYPTIYVNYGRRVKDWGKMTNTLDNLIGKTISPLISVFIHRNGPAELSGALKEKYTQMVVEELVPYIDRTYRTIANPDSRMIMGGSSGAIVSVLAAFSYPGVFNKLMCQSINLSSPATNQQLTKLVQDSDKLPVEFFLHWGKYDLWNAFFSFTALNRTFADIVKEKGYVNKGGEFSHGYGIPSWSSYIDDVLETFFPLKKTKK